MKKILSVIMIAFVAISLGACSRNNANDTFLYNAVVEKTHQHLPIAVISEEFTDTEEYRVWNATNGESEFQVAVPIKYVGHELTEDEQLELSLDIGDNYNYLRLQKILEKYPRLGRSNCIEFDYTVASETEATQEELNDLYILYLKALQELGNIGFFTTVQTPEGEVFFTPYF